MDLSGIATGQQFLERVRECGGKATDGPMEPDWRRGWAVHPFVGRDKVAHWWWRVIPDPHFVNKGVTYAVYTLCGLQNIETIYSEALSTKGIPLLQPGSLPRCRLCAKKARLRSA